MSSDDHNDNALSSAEGLNVMVVGLGQIGMGYDLGKPSGEFCMSHARAFSEHPAFQLVGGVDTDPDRRGLFTAEYGAPAFQSSKEALLHCSVDVAVVAVPTEFHKEALVEVFENSSPRIVVCEKPLSYELGDAQFMVKLCSQHSAELYVNYMRRSDPGAIEVARRIRAHEIHNPFSGVVWYSKGLKHNGSHFVNLLQFWLGEMKNVQVLKTGRLWDGLDPEPDFRATFGQTEITFLAAREERFPYYTVELLAENGRLTYELAGHDITWRPVIDHPIFEDAKTLDIGGEKIVTGMKRFQYNVAEQISRASEGLPAELCDAQEAILTAKTIAKVVTDL